MKIPGFSAEASLESHRGLVVSATEPRDRDLDTVLSPQLMRRYEDRCIPGCICVTGENCPCCDWVSGPRSPLPFPYPGPRAPGPFPPFPRFPF